MLCGDDAEALKALRPLIDARAKGCDVQYAAARAGLKGLLDRVASLDEDRIMRSFMGVIDATLRTGYYQVNDDGSDKRSEEHTSELQSLMRTSYAVFCLKKKTQNTIH